MVYAAGLSKWQGLWHAAPKGA
ncbi:hypothetical protein CBM2585_A60089 [Cupriavidus taiwanensis]|nr:hypothetical protein CBM2585_A60089 [Cupriavidus taiwanensis]